MSTGKMSKHDMKEDKFVTTMFQGASIAKDNLRGVILIVVVLVAFVAGIVIIKSYTSNRKETAQKTLGIAQIAYKAGNFVEARDSLLSLTEKYPKSKSAKIGNFLLGHIYFASGSPDSAEIYWKAFLESKFQDPEMIVAAKAGLAGVKADKGDYKTAALELESLYNENPDFFDKADLLYKAAINFKAAGEREKTKELLKKFIDEYPDSPLVVKAKFFLSAAEAV